MQTAKREVSLILTPLILSILVVGCATTQKEPDTSDSKETAVNEGELNSVYVVVQGKWEQGYPPMANKLPFYYQEWQEGEVKSVSEGYVGWDFNGDGRIDMVQSLNSQGKAIETAFDFDLDGRVDYIEKGVEK